MGNQKTAAPKAKQNATPKPTATAPTATAVVPQAPPVAEQKTTEPELAVTASVATAAATQAPSVTDNQPTAGAVLNEAAAARAVWRHRPVYGEDGNPTGETEAVPVAEDEVLSFALRGNVVTVVTIDGQKLVGAL